MVPIESIHTICLSCTVWPQYTTQQTDDRQMERSASKTGSSKQRVESFGHGLTQKTTMTHNMTSAKIFKLNGAAFCLAPSIGGLLVTGYNYCDGRLKEIEAVGKICRNFGILVIFVL